MAFTILSKNLTITGSNVLPVLISEEMLSHLHKKITKTTGKVSVMTWYKTFDTNTEALSDKAVETTYTYSGQSVLSALSTYYYEDDTAAFTDLVEYKTDNVDNNITYELKTRTIVE